MHTNHIPRSAAAHAAAPHRRSVPTRRAVGLALCALILLVEVGRQGETPRRRLLDLYQQLLAISLIACVGLRLVTIARLVARDYEPVHQFTDGYVGPALRVWVGSRRHATWKAIPNQLAEVLEDWIDYAGIARGSDQSIWLTRQSAAENRSRRFEAVSTGQIARRIAELVRSGLSCVPSDLRRFCEREGTIVLADWLPAAGERDPHLRLVSFQDGVAALLDRAFPRSATTWHQIAPLRDHLARICSIGIWDSLHRQGAAELRHRRRRTNRP